MNAMQKRFLLFLGGCIPVRLLLVWIAKVCPLKYLPYLGLLALLPAFGFMYLFFTGKRTTGLETQGAPIWWSKFRIIHGLFYLLFAIFAINKIASAYKILLADVLFGLCLFLWHHYTNDDFIKVFHLTKMQNK
jgi:hypothetical protein